MAVALLLASCGGGPGTPAPLVAGTYHGPVTITHYYATEAGLELVVTRSGERVTIRGTIDAEDQTLLIDATGTIDPTGLFIASAGGLGERVPLPTDDPQCGRRMWVGGSLVFRGDQAFLGAIMETAICGQITYRATLTKRPAVGAELGASTGATT